MKSHFEINRNILHNLFMQELSFYNVSFIII